MQRAAQSLALEAPMVRTMGEAPLLLFNLKLYVKILSGLLIPCYAMSYLAPI